MIKMDIGKDEKLISEVHSENIQELVKLLKSNEIDVEEYFFRLQDEQKAFNKIMKAFKIYNDFIKDFEAYLKVEPKK